MSTATDAPETAGSSIVKQIKAIGPGAMVAAGFTGPGTVTTASVTGASYDFVLLWSVVAATIGTIIFQEMATRVGLVTGEGLGEAMAGQLNNKVVKVVVGFLVIAAIGIGSMAFQSGNIIGGASGLTTLTGVPEFYWGPLMGLIAGALLFIGRYKLIERALVALVAVMGFSFLGAAILTAPDLGAMAGGFVPTSIPEGGIFLVTGIMGSQIVGYNLFLHASATTERWSGPENIRQSRVDTILSIGLGGIIMIAIMVTAAAVFPTGTEIGNVGEMAIQIEPLVGPYAQFLFSIGLFAAGFTSGMTAPLGAAYAVCGILNWEQDLKAPKFRAIWFIVLAVGVTFSTLGYEPVQAIVFAQVTNGILLPILAVFLIYVLNDEELLGEYANSTVQNILSGAMALFVIWLGVSSLGGILGIF